MNLIVLVAINGFILKFVCWRFLYIMSFYESVFIIRQDVSLNDIDKIVDDFAKIIKDNNGTIIKKNIGG